ADDDTLVLHRLHVVKRSFLKRRVLAAFDADNLCVGGGGEFQLVGRERLVRRIHKNVHGLKADSIGGLKLFSGREERQAQHGENDEQTAQVGRVTPRAPEIEFRGSGFTASHRRARSDGPYLKKIIFRRPIEVSLLTSAATGIWKRLHE